MLAGVRLAVIDSYLDRGDETILDFATVCFKIINNFCVDYLKENFNRSDRLESRLDYQPLFGKMSPHSSPSSGRIKDRTWETAEIEPS